MNIEQGGKDTSSAVSAAAALLLRAVRGFARAEDGALAVDLVKRLYQLNGMDLVLGAFAGGVWVAHPDALGDPSPEAWSSATAAARAILSKAGDTEQVVLAAAALGLIANARPTYGPADDLVRAAERARMLEQHDLAAWCARRALDRHDDLAATQRVRALIVLAVATRDAEVIDRLYRESAELAEDDPSRVITDSLYPTLHPLGQSELIDAAGAAIQAEDRRATAEVMTRQIAGLRARMVGDAMLDGLQIAFAALAGPEPDVDGLRDGLRRVVGHLRDRQRFGQAPPPARAAIDMLLGTLTIRPGPVEAAVMLELLDGLADAGLSELALSGVPTGASGIESAELTDAEMLQADLDHAAARSVDWLSAEALVDALGGRSALVVRERRSRTTPDGCVALHVRPPDGLAIKNRAYPDDTSDTLARFASLTEGANGTGSQADLNRLVEAILPARLCADIEAGLVRELVVVPDGRLWSVPWAAATVLRDVAVALMPSIAMTGRLPRAPAGPVRTVLAVVDDNAPGAAAVVDALHTVRATDRLRVTYRDDLPDPGDTGQHDLLLYFGHGAGSGLTYRLATVGGRRTALAVARSGAFRQALLAACWSAGGPPVGSALSLPAILSAGGISPVVGGRWPLPGTDTGRIVGRTVHELAVGRPLVTALRVALSAVPVSTRCAWGLTVYGLPEAGRSVSTPNPSPSAGF